MVSRTGRGYGPSSDQSSPRHQQSGLGWGRRTHDGCTERLEGVSPASVEVGGIESLKESHMVEALRLRIGGGGL